MNSPALGLPAQKNAPAQPDLVAETAVAAPANRDAVPLQNPPPGVDVIVPDLRAGPHTHDVIIPEAEIMGTRGKGQPGSYQPPRQKKIEQYTPPL